MRISSPGRRGVAGPTFRPQSHGPSSAVASFQLRLVFGAATDAFRRMAQCRVLLASGAKAGIDSKTRFKLRALSFRFLSQRARRAAFRDSIAPKTPVLKLKCLFACEPPAAIGSESTQVAFRQFAKPQVIRFSYCSQRGIVPGGYLMSSSAIDMATSAPCGFAHLEVKTDIACTMLSPHDVRHCFSFDLVVSR